MFRMYVILNALILLGSVPMTGADIYRWTDHKGDVHFTDNETDIPENYREKAKKVKLPVQKQQSSGDTKAGYSAGTPRNKVDRDDQGHSADYWRARVLEAKEALREAREEKRMTEEKLMRSNALTTPQGELTRMKDSLAQSEKRIQELQKALDVDIPEEARKAGAMPGWLRVD